MKRYKIILSVLILVLMFSGLFLWYSLKKTQQEEKLVNLHDLVGDKKLLYTESQDKYTNLYLYDFTENKKNLLAGIEGSIDEVKVSPDKNKVLFSSFGMIESENYVYQFENQRLDIIDLAGENISGNLHWSVGSEYIYYVNTETGNNSTSEGHRVILRRYNLNTGQKETINIFDNFISDKSDNLATVSRVDGEDIYMTNTGESPFLNFKILKYNLNLKSSEEIVNFSENEKYKDVNLMDWIDEENILLAGSLKSSVSEYLCLIYNIKTKETEEISNCNRSTNYILSTDTNNIIYINFPTDKDMAFNLIQYNIEDREEKFLSGIRYTNRFYLGEFLPYDSKFLYEVDSVFYIYDIKKGRVDRVNMPGGIELYNIQGWY